jgi:hypothetical protein
VHGGFAACALAAVANMAKPANPAAVAAGDILILVVITESQPS